MAEKNKGGRPPLYKNADDLSDKIDEYFEYVQGEYTEQLTTNLITFADEIVKVWIREPERIAVTGLVLYLGFESRQSLQDYKKKLKFSYPIKRALTRVEREYENFLFERNPSGGSSH